MEFQPRDEGWFRTGAVGHRRLLWQGGGRHLERRAVLMSLYGAAGRLAVSFQRRCGCLCRHVRYGAVIFGGTAEQVLCGGSAEALIGVLAEQSSDHWPQ
jgi:hypothetical protein